MIPSRHAPDGVARPRAAEHLGTLASYVCALGVVASSFVLYASRLSAVRQWDASNNDPADYRFIAEYFWRIPFAPATYDVIWHGGWGAYLRTIPFRGIGLGTLYLLVGVVRLGHAPATPEEVLMAGVALATVEKILLGAALLAVFTAVRRHWGTAAGLIALLILAFPPQFWRMNDDFLTEPVQRIVFLFALACAVSMVDRRSTERRAFVLVFLFLLAAHLKVQWWFGAFLLLPALLVQFRAVGLPRSAWVLLSLATALVPLMVVAVNWIGWRSTSLSPGIGLHVNLKYDGDVLRAFSRATERDTVRPLFADLNQPPLRWWNIYIDANASHEDYDRFDAYARAYVRARPHSALRSFWEGLRLASTVPGIERVERGLIRLRPLNEPWAGLVRSVDVVVWTLLILGLLFDETRMPCALALVLWIVPAIGNVFSPYEARYHLPMAGLGAVAACGVLVTVSRKRRLTDS